METFTKNRKQVTQDSQRKSSMKGVQAMILSPKRKLLRILAVFVIFAFILIISGCVDNKPKELPKNYTNSLGMEFVLIPAGEYQMGSYPYANKPFDFDTPVHNVNIQKPFYMSKYEVTQKEWTEIMGSNPSLNKGENLPVDNVLQSEVQSFILKLNIKQSVASSNKYRLPTEAEWEYACRAGTTTRFFFGDENKDLIEYGWSKMDANNTSHPVGLKRPNALGLYDMNGNVWEMTADNWHNNYTGAPSDGSAWLYDGSSVFVGRGGSWYDGPGICSSNFRGSYHLDTRNPVLGFRLIKDV